MIGIEPGSAVMLEQKIFSACLKMAPGPPPIE